MVGCAIAQAMAFPYTDYMDDRIDQGSTRHKKRNGPNFCQKFFQIVFASRDVIDDARNTFIKDIEDERERATQLDVMRTKAFNWSDEELIQDNEEAAKRLQREKYGKRKQTNYQKALIYKQNVQNKLAGKASSDTKYKKLKDDKNQRPIAQIQMSIKTSPDKGREGSQLLKHYNDEDDLENITINVGGRETELTASVSQEISGN